MRFPDSLGFPVGECQVVNPVDLHRSLVLHFDLSELQTLCFDLGVDYENLSGSNKADKCRELIAYFQRRGKLGELIDYCQQQRPHLTWRAADQASSSHTEKNAQDNLISVLFIAADPTDVTRLRLGTELREIQEKLQLARLRDKFSLTDRLSSRPADLTQAMLDFQPRIIHFSGHGDVNGSLVFEDSSGKSHPIQPQALAALFENFSDQVKCIILNACYSDVLANALAEHVEVVIGMDRAISDPAAIAFSIGFYQAIGAGRTFPEAYRLGCAQIGLQGLSEQATPILTHR
jgi:hypothetical protein